MIIALQTLLFFRETLIRALDAFLRPYYKNFSLALTRQGDVSDDEGSEDHVFAEYHDEKGVVFFPPVYVQRYAAVTDCLMDDNWCGRLEKVVEFGYHDLSFIKYLKEVPGIQHIMGVDIEAIPLQSSSDLLGCEDYGQKRENPLKVTLFQGNAADPDYRLIGCDAVVAIEMIEHMLPHDLERFLHTVFGFIKPWVVVLTTPNGDFNVLFKSLENNGLRRLDHFFEWSREQFYDWCSNIVLRYPDYTVTCKGIGPGPPDTAQLGCCTQMAVFVAKDYHKQQELDISSLALVASKDVPSLSIEDMTSSYECIPDNKILCLTNDVELYPEISSNKQSCVTIVLTSPMYSYHAIEYDDKSFQCNLDTELEKAFLFEDEPYRVLIPRRKRLYKIYDIEDVNNRLNCSTLQVKKFSKTTQNVIAMNKMDSSFTREVVDEIRHLKKMLNLNKECECTGEHTWFNINWGENAPYWNQYYRVVREYSYPFERKSDDSRILDLISEEINRLVDKQWDDDFPSEGNLEIPLTLLMDVVAHLTNDVDKVKELLEWNGYQVVDDVVIHSRLIVDTTSVGTHDDDWPDNDTVSDWDISEVHSTSISDGSTNMPDYYGRCLRKALDHKVRKLRTLLSADEDITSELDGVVCRLMKLALHTTRNRQCPVPSSWVQCKLFDLLTLTEKAIERRRKHYFDECMLKAIDNGKSKDKNSILALINVKLENRRADEIMHKYRNLIEPIRTFDDDKFKLSENCIEELDLEDDNEFFQDENQNLQIVSEPISHDEEIESVMQKPKTKLDIVREWIGGDYKNMFSSYHQDMDVSKSTYQIHNIQSNYSVAGYLDKIDISSPSSGTVDDKIKLDRKPTKSHPKTAKKSSKRKMNYTFLLKKYYSKFGDTDTMCKNKGKKHHKQLSIAAAPVRINIIHKKTEKEHVKTETENACKIRDVSDYVNYDNIAATEKCHIISIITQDSEEQVALRRSIGTDPGPSIIDHEAALETVINITKHDSLCNFKEYDSEDVPGQMIFLYDINEPSTSKGIRRGGLDVQCGPDDVPHCDMLSATTSFTKFPKLFSKGIKIEHSTTNICCEKTFDEGTSPDFTSPYKSAHPYMGIRIIDSDTKIQDKNVTESTTMTTHDFLDDTSKCCNPKTTLIKSISVNETDHIKSPKRLLSPLLKSDVQIQSGGSKVDIGRKSPVRVKSKLSCGGIHVHSFKDREVSQDVIFQGGWNEITPDKLAKKNNKKAVPKKVVYTTKKLKRGSNTSVKNHGNSDVKNALKRPIKIRTTKQILKKEQTNKIMPNKKFPPTRNRNMLIRNVKKASSKTVSNTLENTNAIRHKEITKPASFERPNIEHYLPAYLKRNRSAGVNKFSSKSLDSPKLINIKKPQFLRSSMEEKSNLRQQFIRCNSEDEKRNDLKEIKNNSTVYVSYQVFRNEVKNKRITEKVQSANRQVIGSNSTPKRSGSPDSQLSTCSSPNSVGTVRAVSSIVTVDSCKKCSTSSTTNNRNSPTATIPKTNFGSKIKNIIKKNKYEKKNDNKENIPTPLKNAKRGFVGTTKNIFRAHTSCDTTHLSKTKLHLKKSSNKLPNIKSSGNLLKKSSSLLSEKVNDEPSNENNVLQSSPSDTVLILERFSSYKDLSKDLDESINFNSNNLFSKTTEHIDEVCINPNCITSKSAHSMEILIKDMLEETLKSISITPESNLKRDILFKNDKSLNNTSSPISFKTVIENKDSSSFKLSLEEAIDTSFNKVSENATITEKTEKKSLESMCTSSKQSEYFLADNQLDLCEFSSMINEPSDSVQGLFERKNQNIVTNVGGPIALQAFSGFSVNGIPLAGDQPQYINLVDPESGLLRPQINRQTESEEILLSGRSSDTYESCYVEDESFVPSWLFNLINQHHSNDESEEDENLVPYPLPIAEPVLDIDDVDIDGVGVGAGAGDGRGVHSDRSRDSSGRGTSLSSSETSTDTPTGGEAVIVDPSTFVGLYEFVREAADSSTFDRPNESPDTSFTTAEADTGDVNRPRSRSRTAASDIDADVSSLDTDAIDSDNYE
ncbi:uncharacterized protein LOC123707143 isoform X2 [Pieris brassicae]|uniref:uncharacterized protein LOC123707143 isoform X2 n=1 Tax=Pieris brassicae TaxID=7116 RepID=UPI001E65E3B0|nr:uncharacterized protein LOC123707143 isoform X2 [Pieris brassicae]